jgi:hypothetical protein
MDPKPAVINISVAWKDSWREADEAIKACIDAGISVVAAMGDTAAYKDVLDNGDDPDCNGVTAAGSSGTGKGNNWYADSWYPAKLSDTTDVIAVAGTDVNDLRLPDSDTGEHVWLAAPGEDIVTVVSQQNLGTRNGTSFAAALVAAAVWRASVENPKLSPGQIKELLAETADRQTVWLDRPNRKDRKGEGCWRWDSNIGCGRLNVSALTAAAKHGPSYPLPTVTATTLAVSMRPAESPVKPPGTPKKQPA